MWSLPSADVVSDDLHAIVPKQRVIVERHQIVFEFFAAIPLIGKFVEEQLNVCVHIPVRVTVLKAECVLNEVIVQDKILIIYMIVFQVAGGIHVLKEHDAYLDFACFDEVKECIHH